MLTSRPITKAGIGHAFVLALLATPASALIDLRGVVEVSAGREFFCALTDAGAVKCWGRNEFGNLGDGTTSDRATATRIPGLETGVVQVSAGYDHACALTSGGGVKCWGANASGQLGNGTQSPSSSPVDVTDLASGVATISAGGNHSCAVTTGGGVKCWGANDAGQLGDGSSTLQTTPVDVTGLPSGVSTVSASLGHTCAMTSTGGVKCWGANDAGQLGDGTTTPRPVPGDVTGLASGVVSIAVGRGPDSTAADNFPSYAGGLSCAVLATGAAKCWGNEVTGELGNGAAAGDQPSPVDVQGLAGAVKISIGLASRCTYKPNTTVQNYYSNHACAVANGGGLKCWGGNTHAELGSTLPEVNAGECGPNVDLPPPISNDFGQSDVAVDATVVPGPSVDVAAGTGRTCAVVAGKAQCWGMGIPEGTSGNAMPMAVQVTESGLTPQFLAFTNNPYPVPLGGSATLTVVGGESTSPTVLTSLTPDICSVSGMTVNGLANGICVIAADRAGDAIFDPAVRVTVNLLVGGRVAQTVAFGPPPPLVAGSYGIVTASASSGLPLNFGTTTANCVFQPGDMGILAALQAGTCGVSVLQQGNEFYLPATVSIDIAVGAAGPTTDLSVTQVLDTASPQTHKDVVYSITVRNAGPTTSGATLVEQLPEGLAFIWGWPSCSESNRLVTCALPTLAPGASTPAKIVVRPSLSGAWDQRVVVVGTVPETSEPTNNHAITPTPVAASSAGTPIQRYRLYSPVTLEHHFTTDLNEYNTLGGFVGTWIQEGTVGKVLSNPGSFGGVWAVPYYRLYDTAARWHHWTTDPNEYYTLGLFPGWVQEGVDGWILPTNTAGATELFRLLYPFVPGLHHWTIDANEFTTLINSFGWIGEPGAGFVVQ